MQRRHFEAIADALRETRASMPYDADSELRREGYEAACATMERELIQVCKRANPQFDTGRFREACQPATEYRNKSRASARL